MKYKITVESLDSDKTITFETENHDNMFRIFEAGGANPAFENDERLSLVLGLKLFSEIMLKRKDFAPFEVLRPVFGNFMKAFKEEMKPR